MAVAVFGMQDGREKFGKLVKNVFAETSTNKFDLNATGPLSGYNVSDKVNKVVSPKSSVKGGEVHKSVENDDELERLRMENAKLMKMLEENEKMKNDKVTEKDGAGMCSTTCNIF
jgi:hypothetical protein